MNRLECISVLREQGINIIPLKPESKIPQIPWAKYQEERCTETISDNANLGIICGKTSDNLVIVDIDSGDESLLDHIFPNAKNQTLVVKTGRGYHVYLKTDALQSTARLENEILGHIDVQSQGTYCVGPTSIHPDTKKEYEIVSTITKITKVDFQQIINNLEKLGFKTAQTKQSISEIMKNGVQEGSRNSAMFKVACNLLQEQKLDETTTFSFLRAVNERNKPPLSNAELVKILESATKYKENEKALDENQNAYDLAISKIKKLVVSQNNSKEVYAVIEINGHDETLELSSRRASYWLNYICRTNHIGKIHGDEYFRNILNTIIAQAQINNTPREKVYNRIAISNDTLYYDLATSDWNIAKISSNGIEILPYDVKMPIFRRSQTSAEQVKPIYDNTYALNDLATLLRIKDKQIFKVHLVSLFLENIPVPIMVFDGAAGSMKTTTTAAIKRIVDPSGYETEDNCTSMAAQNDDLVLQLYNRYLSAFDNVTRINQETSNVLCRAVTGSSNGRRELYTNSDETLLNFRRKIVLNGIVLNPDFPDLQDRMIVYDRIPLENNERLTEQEFQKKFKALLPSVLWQIFAVIQRSFAQYESVKNQIRPTTRLADFEIWGETISRSMDYEPNSFLEKYFEKQRRTSIAVKDLHPIVAAIETLIDGKEEYENTVARCYSELSRIAYESGVMVSSQYARFPKAPQRLKEEIIKVKPILEKLGIAVYFEHYTKADGKYTKNSTIIYIRAIKKQSQSSPHSPCSLSQNESQNAGLGEPIGEDTKQKTEYLHSISQ